MTPDGLADRVRSGDRAALARALTLVESRRPDHRDAASELMRQLRSAGTTDVDTTRVGVSGVPGVGKSTFIDAVGAMLLEAGHRVAVLAVDPSSARSGGSILGDKTRMHRLAVSDAAFVRPSPTAGTLGGVARATREAVVLVEAAGYDIVLVETVGVGQSEFAVADLVDTFCLLTIARTGDELQGIKRGILELADVVAVNKAEGSHRADAERAGGELSTALHLVRGDEAWEPPVIACSAREETGLDDVWDAIARHRDHLGARGLSDLRRRQEVQWLRSLVRDRLLAPLDEPGWRERAAEIEQRVSAGALAAEDAVDLLVARRPGPSLGSPSHHRRG